MNYHHLRYFWVVAKEGGFARAAERLGVAVQTASAQVRALELALGHQLLRPAGRGVALTEAGRVALARAEEVFRVGETITDDVRAAATGRAARLVVGLSDGISKLAAHALLLPALASPAVQLVCHEGELGDLVADLALHRLDLVLAGEPAPPNPNLRLTSDRIVSAAVDWVGPSTLVRRAAIAKFPESLAELPLLLPTSHAPLRARVDHWLERRSLRVRVAGEFEDSALMAVFAARGMGVFPVSRLGAGDLALTRGLRRLGRSDDLVDEIHAILSRRGLQHPLVAKVLAAARR